LAGSGDHATAISLFSGIVTGLYRRERTGKGSYVTTSLLATGVWSSGIAIQGALCDAKFFPPHDRLKPTNATFNVYQSSDDHWFLIVTTPDHWRALATSIGRPDLLTDARFADPAKQAVNAAALAEILDKLFRSQPLAHWREAFETAHVPFGIVQTPAEVINDPQLHENDIIVPLEGAGGKLNSTISSPIQVHGVAKVPARRAPGIGEHNEEILEQLGFSESEIEGLQASGAVPDSKRQVVASKG
jgi:crotonobetainyl-CoA:carnitine CoA-transferase CaiB-like acyl-CoA transferase